LFRYLKETSKHGLQFGKQKGLVISSFSDFAGDPDTARSTSGYVVKYNGVAVGHRSKLQKTVGESSKLREKIWLQVKQRGRNL
jgi:SpoVK/Ycf46/Vps4 family AAA+-type ATPase